ncbi:MAG: hypothetical protein L3J67_04250 [Hyphomicrobiaceae bacterium]|nr:hypothetical protein [Hyphomicrobiaceae bacterium]
MMTEMTKGADGFRNGSWLRFLHRYLLASFFTAYGVGVCADTAFLTSLPLGGFMNFDLIERIKKLEPNIHSIWPLYRPSS